MLDAGYWMLDEASRPSSAFQHLAFSFQHRFCSHSSSIRVFWSTMLLGNSTRRISPTRLT